MDTLDKKFDFLISLESGMISSKESTEKLLDIEKYLISNLENTHLAFSKSEYQFSNSLDFYLTYYISSIDKYLPFLTTNSRKQNINLLKKIHHLFKKKTSIIKSIYEKDINIVEDYMIYAKRMMNTGEMFYFLKDYEHVPWAQKEFPENMFNYLSCHLRLNPKYLTKDYIEFMRGHFTFSALGIDDEEKVLKLNQYFSTTNDPFSQIIPYQYNEVKLEIRMTLTLFLSNEKLFMSIVEVVKNKYIE